MRFRHGPPANQPQSYWAASIAKVHSLVSAEVFFEPSPSARNLTVQLNKVGNCVWRAAAKAAFGSYAEIGHNSFYRCKSTSRAGHTIGTMHESQIQFSAGIDLHVRGVVPPSG